VTPAALVTAFITDKGLIHPPYHFTRNDAQSDLL